MACSCLSVTLRLTCSHSTEESTNDNFTATCIEACQAYKGVPSNTLPCVGVALGYFDGTSNPAYCFLKEYKRGSCYPNSYYVESA